jgi:hypothetical protein
VPVVDAPGHPSPAAIRATVSATAREPRHSDSAPMRRWISG